MHSHLSQHFRDRRIARGLGFKQLAQLLGYQNVAKGCNRIQRFEQRGHVHADLLRKLAAVLEIDEATVDALIEADRRKAYLAWNEWANQPIQPHVVVRIMAAVYRRERLPEGIAIDEAETLAADIACHWKCRACLVWTRRLSVWFDELGTIEHRTEAGPGEPNVPTMRLGRSKRLFTLGDPETGQGILTIVNWP
jgi:transcriptional regulator with XRE-family HTH domain